MELSKNIFLAIKANVLPFHNVVETRVSYFPILDPNANPFNTIDKKDKRIGITTELEYYLNDFIVFRLGYQYIGNITPNRIQENYDKYSLFSLAYAIYF